MKKVKKAMAKNKQSLNYKHSLGLFYIPDTLEEKEKLLATILQRSGCLDLLHAIAIVESLYEVKIEK